METIQRRCADLRNGDIVNEDDFSSSLVTSLRDELNGLRLSYEPRYTPGIGTPYSPEYTVHARSTDNRYRGSEENSSGADILMGFRGYIDGEWIKKAALIQAKLFSGEGEFLTLPENAREMKYLLNQCRRMREIAGPDSYILIYSRVGVRFYSAVDYIESFPNVLSYSSGKNFDEFVRGIFSCSIGKRDMDYMPLGRFKAFLKKLGIKFGFDANIVES